MGKKSRRNNKKANTSINNFGVNDRDILKKFANLDWDNINITDFSIQAVTKILRHVEESSYSDDRLMIIYTNLAMLNIKALDARWTESVKERSGHFLQKATDLGHKLGDIVPYEIRKKLFYLQNRFVAIHVENKSCNDELLQMYKESVTNQLVYKVKVDLKVHHKVILAMIPSPNNARELIKMIKCEQLLEWANKDKGDDTVLWYTSCISRMSMFIGDFYLTIAYNSISLEIDGLSDKHRAETMANIGYSYTNLRHHRQAMEIFEEALPLAKKVHQNDIILKILAYKGLSLMFHSKYQLALEAMSEGDQYACPEASLDYVKLLINRARVYFELKEWYRCIEILEKSVECMPTREAYDYLAITYLQLYRLRSEARGVESIVKGYGYLQKRSGREKTDFFDNTVPTDHYYSIELWKVAALVDEDSEDALYEIFEKEVTNYMDPSTAVCDCSGQRQTEEHELLRCDNCKVKYYCSRKHQKWAWKRSIASHKSMCPYLKRWRKVKKAMKRDGDCESDSFAQIVMDFSMQVHHEYNNTEKFGYLGWCPDDKFDSDVDPWPNSDSESVDDDGEDSLPYHASFLERIRRATNHVE